MPTLERWTPIRELDQMERRMRRFFEDIGFMPGLAPAADVYETESELIVELEVPGFDEKQLEVEVADHTLTVKGKREEETAKEEKAIRVRERLEKQFERSFVLPAQTDSEHVVAEYANGVLTLHVPKTETPERHKVEIAKA